MGQRLSGQAPREDVLRVSAAFRPLVVGLLDLDGGWSLFKGAASLQGRAVSARHSVSISSWDEGTAASKAA